MTTNTYGQVPILTRLAVGVLTALFLVAGIFLSAVFFALFLVLALFGAAWLWWQRRNLRRNAAKSDYIEAEYEVIEQSGATQDDAQPPNRNRTKI